MASLGETVSNYGTKLEDTFMQYAAPVKPYIPTISRFLLVVTFIEDAFRIAMQWGEQNNFMKYQRGFPSFTSELFLGANVIAMLVCSFLAVQRRHTEYAVGGLATVVVSQALGYGMIFDFKFLLYNFSIIGGLLLLLSENMLAKRKAVFAGLPTVTRNEQSTYILLAGRILLVFLFLGFVFAGEFTFTRMIISAIGLVACVMVAIGFKAKWSALFMVLFLSIINVFINNWWSLSEHHFERDHIKYDFFQTLSTVGGFLLLVSVGPGGLSMDEKKKAF